MEKLLLTADECSKATGLCRALIEQAIRDGRLIAAQAGGRVLVRRERLDEWIVSLEQSVGAPPKGPQPLSAEAVAQAMAELPRRSRDLDRWREIWRTARVLDRARYTIPGMVLALRKKLPDVTGLSEDTLVKILRAGKAGLLID